MKEKGKRGGTKTGVNGKFLRTRKLEEGAML